jgi:hypothetical protein
MDSAVNSSVHKLFKAKVFLFFISEMTLALETVGERRGTHYNNKNCLSGTLCANGNRDQATRLAEKRSVLVSNPAYSEGPVFLLLTRGSNSVQHSPF